MKELDTVAAVILASLRRLMISTAMTSYRHVDIYRACGSQMTWLTGSGRIRRHRVEIAGNYSSGAGGYIVGRSGEKIMEKWKGS